MADKKVIKLKGKDYYINQLKKLGVSITDEQVSNLQPEDLEVSTPELNSETPGGDGGDDGGGGGGQGYHCEACGGSVTKGQAHCNGCGKYLDWAGLQ